MCKLVPALIIYVLSASAQQSSKPPDSRATALPTGDYVCPMDKDVRSDKPGSCPRCGMMLKLGIPDEIEYPMELKVKPSLFRARDKVQLEFRIDDPTSTQQVNHFEIVHEKLFHLFVVSQDLQFFLHEHPVPQTDGSFLYELTFPKPGMYRVVGDFYPSGGTPQLTARTLIVPGAAGEEIKLEQAKIEPELGVSHGENTDVELVTEPPNPLAGIETRLLFKLKDAAGLEKYLGAWAHMLAASDDLIDVIHDHPFLADGGPQMQFNVVFPRARTYRIWIQFLRLGKVNTVSFSVPIRGLNESF
jgi:hypothetical protein